MLLPVPLTMEPAQIAAIQIEGVLKLPALLPRSAALATVNAAVLGEMPAGAADGFFVRKVLPDQRKKPLLAFADMPRS